MPHAIDAKQNVSTAVNAPEAGCPLKELHTFNVGSRTTLFFHETHNGSSKISRIELVEPGLKWLSYGPVPSNLSHKLSGLIRELEKPGISTENFEIRASKLSRIASQMSEARVPGISNLKLLFDTAMAGQKIFPLKIPTILQLELAASTIKNGQGKSLCHNLGAFPEHSSEITGMLIKAGFLEEILFVLPRLNSLPGYLFKHLLNTILEPSFYETASKPAHKYTRLLSSLAKNIESFRENERPSLIENSLKRLCSMHDIKGFFTFYNYLPGGLVNLPEIACKLLRPLVNKSHATLSNMVEANKSLLLNEKFQELFAEAVGIGGMPTYMCLKDSVLEKLNSSQMARALLKYCDSFQVAQRLDCFKGLDPDIALKIVEDGHGDELLSSLHIFRAIPAEIGMLLVQKGQVNTLLKLFPKIQFKIQQTTAIMEEIIENRQMHLILENLSTIPAHVLEPLEGRFYLAGYKRDIGVPSTALYKRYRVFKNANQNDKIDELRLQVDRLFKKVLSPSPIPDSFRNDPIYLATCEAAFPERLLHDDDKRTPPNLKDHSERLNKYRYNNSYRIDLSGAVDMVLQPRKRQDESVIENCHYPVQQVTDQMAALQFEKEKMRLAVHASLCEALQHDTEKPATSEQLLLDFMVRASQDKNFEIPARRLLIAYHFAGQANLRGYLEGTRDHAANSRNQRYAYLLLLREFFFDQLSDTISKVIDIAVPTLQKGRKDKSYYISHCMHLFSPQIRNLDLELAKYQVAPGQAHQPKVIEAFFSMNAVSSRARGSAATCIPGDVQQWDDERFFQLVIKDRQLRRCEGAMLLNDITDSKKRILHASFQPSSTLLYKINQEELFKEIMKVLISFSEMNGFDCIACSKDERIRTNRTGGSFELAMIQAIRQMKTTLLLSKSTPFSYDPAYDLKELDVLWYPKAHADLWV